MVVRFFLCVGLIVLVAGCGQPLAETESPGDVPLSEFERLRQQYGASSNGDQSLDALLAMASSEPWAQSETLAMSVIAQNPNDRLALDLVGRELQSRDAAEAAAFIEELLESFPDSAAGAKALQVELDSLKSSDTTAFLARCAWAIEEAPGDWLARAGLYNRLNYFRENGEAKKAALDAFQFWARFPQFVQERNIGTRLAGTVRLAGLMLEAEILERSDDPASVASALAEEFHADTGLGRTYFDAAPSRLRESIGDDTGLSACNRALHYLRQARLALDAREYDDAFSSASVAMDVDAALAECVSREGSFSILIEALDTFLTSTVKTFGSETLSDIFSGDRGAKKDAVVACRTLCRVGWLLHEARLSDARHAGETLLEVTERYREALSQLGDHAGVLDFYEEVMKTASSSGQLPTILMRVADYYENDLESKSEAAGIYERVRTEFPNDPEASTATLKQAQMYLDLDRHSDSYDVLQAFLVSYPEDSRVPVAKYMSALAEVYLGLEEQGVNHMWALTQEHPQSRAAANALYWVGSYELSRQEYGKAKAALEDLVTRYPDSLWRDEAESLLTRLESIPKS